MIDRTNLFNSVKKVCLLHGEFALRSGSVSNYYFDKYAFESDPNLLDSISRELLNMVSSVDYEILGGIEMGGIPIATIMSSISKKPTVFIRKKAKEYGTERLAEGLEVKGKKILLVEDVISTGGQVIKSTKELRKLGAEVIGVVSVICRDKEAVHNLDFERLNYMYLFDLFELR